MNVSTEFKPVLTRAALALKKTEENSEFTAMVFQEPQGTTNTAEDAGAATSKATDKNILSSVDNEFDMKKARSEVLSFAMQNQRTIKNKRKMEIQQLIKLGAKPPRKAYKNYKELKEERKRLNDIREERKKFHQLGKNQTGAASVKCNKSKTQRDRTQKKRAPVANISQHYGKAQPKFKKKK